MTLFTDKAPKIMRQFMQDFSLDESRAAAILGNVGHECLGFTKLQEIKPVVKGSRGGYGWPMWTGPRRRNYEAYCARNGLNPASDEANYAYMFVELTSTERGAITALKNAVGLPAQVKAFENHYERAGVKHYPSRIKYAEQALAAFKAQDTSGALKPPVVIPPPPDIEPIDPTPAKPSSEGFFMRLIRALWAAIKGD
jgi:hypothetical protein